MSNDNYSQKQGNQKSVSFNSKVQIYHQNQKKSMMNPFQNISRQTLNDDQFLLDDCGQEGYTKSKSQKKQIHEIFNSNSEYLFKPNKTSIWDCQNNQNFSKSKGNKSQSLNFNISSYNPTVKSKQKTEESSDQRLARIEREFEQITKINDTKNISSIKKHNSFKRNTQYVSLDSYQNNNPEKIEKQSSKIMKRLSMQFSQGAKGNSFVSTNAKLMKQRNKEMEFKKQRANINIADVLKQEKQNSEKKEAQNIKPNNVDSPTKDSYTSANKINNQENEQVQKMEIQQNINEIQSSFTKQKIDKKIGETKDKLSRLTMNMAGLVNMLTEVDQQQKNTFKAREMRKKRVTMDLRALTDMLSLKDEKDQEVQQKIKKRNTQYLMNIKQKDQIIYQDAEQDVCTPFKGNGLDRFSEKSLINPKSAGQRSVSKQNNVFKRDTIGSVKQLRSTNFNNVNRNISKQVFQYYFQQIQTRIDQEKKQIQQIQRLKQEGKREYQKTMNVLKTKAQRQQQIMAERQTIVSQIKQANQAMDPQSFEEYMHVIHSFQTKLGIKIYSYEKQKVLNSESYEQNEKVRDTQGFFGEFTIDSILFRLKRLQGQYDPMVKLVNMVEPIDKIHTIKFDQASRSTIFTHFINRKLKRCKNMLDFVIRMTNFNNQLKKIEENLQFLTFQHNIKDIQMNTAYDKLTFVYELAAHWSYIFTIELIEITQKNIVPINIYDNLNQMYIKVPIDFKPYGEYSLSNSFAYVLKSMDLNLKEDIEKKIKKCIDQ